MNSDAGESGMWEKDKPVNSKFAPPAGTAEAY
jgi:hypothetical protein